MSDDRYRKIVRSKPSNPPVMPRRKTRLPLGLDRLFVRNRRACVVLIIFFILGTTIGGYLGSTPPMGKVQNNLRSEQQARMLDDRKPPVNVRVYAYKSRSKNQKPSEIVKAVPAQTIAPSPLAKKHTAPQQADPVTKSMEMTYAAPLEANVKEVRIAIVIDDLGIDQKRTQRTIKLKAPLTLAFLPYGYNLNKLTEAAKVAGHELIVHLPMQPTGNDADPGPKALTRGLSKKEIRERLSWNLSQFQGFVGINNHMGSSFSAWDEGMTIVLRELKNRRLFYLDSLTSPNSVARRVAATEGIKILTRDIFLDNKANIDRIANRLTELERIARRRGYAIGIGHPYDATTDALSVWLPTLREKGIELVPVSHLQQQR